MKKLFLLLVIALGFTSGISAQSFNLDTLKDILGGIIANDKVTVKSIAGTWVYSAPAVTLKSDNIVKKAGGAAASSAVEAKLAPYYKKAGLTKVELTIEADSTFTMKLSKASLKGTLSTVSNPESDANFQFNFTIGGAFPIGKMDAYITKSGSNNLTVTFDVSKLVALIEKAGAITNNSSLKSITALLEEYDGVCAGFKLTKSK